MLHNLFPVIGEHHLLEEEIERIPVWNMGGSQFQEGKSHSFIVELLIFFIFLFFKKH